MVQATSGTGQSLAQENERLKKVIETMKLEMDSIVERVKAEYAVQSPKSENHQYARL